jgi:hypothetical protein
VDQGADFLLHPTPYRKDRMKIDFPDWVIKKAIETAKRVEAETHPAPEDSMVESFKRLYPQFFDVSELEPESEVQ